MARKLVIATFLAVALVALLMAVTPRSAPAPAASRIEVQRLPPLEVVPPARPVPAGQAAEEGAATESDGDGAIRALVAGVSSHPALLAWLASDGLLERFVLGVSSVAGGLSPRDELAPLRPVGRFVVETRGERRVVGASSFRRYDLVAEVVASVDAGGAVGIYRQLLPQLEAVHRRVAWQTLPFEAVLAQALDELLAVPIPDGELEVEARVLTYAFADPDLEALSDAQRHLLRMGSGNARQVQAKLREIRRLLVASPPPSTDPATDGARGLSPTALVASAADPAWGGSTGPTP